MSGQDFGRLGAGFLSARGRIPVGSGPDSRPRARERGAPGSEFPSVCVSGGGPGPGRGPGPRFPENLVKIMNFLKFHEIL